MAEALETPAVEGSEEYVKPDPKINPRNIALAEISKTVADQHKVEFAETAPTVDDDNLPAEPAPGVPTEEEPAPAETGEEVAPETPAEPAASAPAAAPAQAAIDPTKEYQVTIDGQKVMVPGQKIIDAGFRTFQKETAAEYRLQLASDLLRKAEEQVRTATPTGAAPAAPQAPTAELSDAELAQAIQYGSPEQAAAALKALRGKPAIDPAQVMQIATAQARSELAFQEGLNFVKQEYADLLENPATRELFFLRENKYRAPVAQGGKADARSPKELYQAIGEEIRKELGRPKPVAGTTAKAATVASTAQSRQERKAAVPSVPRTAAGRLAAGQDAPKAKTTSEIIAGMAAARGKTSLTNTLRKEN